MTGALAWLNELMTWCAAWVPRLVIVLKSERGIRYRLGADVSILKPGVGCYWPIVTQVQKVNVMRQTLNLSTQTITTADGEAIIVSGIVVYTIADVVLYLVENENAASGMDEVTCAAVRDVLLGRTFAEIQAASMANALDADLRKAARKRLGPFGVKVESCRLTDLARTRVLSLQGIPYDLHLTQYSKSAEAA